MIGATVADMLADLIGPAKSAWSGATPAKAAKAAKNRASIDAAGDSGACEGLRKVANLQPEPAAPTQDSQKFAALRRGVNRPQSEHPCGFSQDSQNSQGVAGTIASAQPRSRPYKLTKTQGDAAHAEAWNDAAIARFVARVSLFLRRGFDATDADDLAERLHLRDMQGDDHVLCVECTHLAGRTGAWRCGNHRVAGVGRELPAALVTMLQRCPAVGPSRRIQTAGGSALVAAPVDGP